VSAYEHWDSLRGIGRDSTTGGYRRFAWNPAELECRAWFEEEAGRRGLAVERDRNGNIWAWWGRPGPSAVAVGSHLDSVPDGGAYDGALGVASALAAVDLLKRRGVEPQRPVVMVSFSDEEGARFGVPCLGSQLMTGDLDPARAIGLVDQEGMTLGEAMAEAGWETTHLGRDDHAVGRLSAFVELHIEQGRGLCEDGAPVGLASAIWPHGRWRFRLRGEANHAGTTAMRERHDPMLSLARLVQGANQEAHRCCGVATVGKVLVDPNGTNAIPSNVDAWLDARAPDDAGLDAMLAGVESAMAEQVPGGAQSVEVFRESYSRAVHFDDALRDRLRATLGEVPVLPTAAGHDAGILAARVPTAMLFVRNPDGVSHSPEERITDDDCQAGVEALAKVVEELACR
jgi:N-carbamoyl-L-amino-acid hydrolase